MSDLTDERIAQLIAWAGSDTARALHELLRHRARAAEQLASAGVWPKLNAADRELIAQALVDYKANRPADTKTWQAIDRYLQAHWTTP